MYLVDTNVISEARKGRRADTGVRAFFESVARRGLPVLLSVVTVGELRRGVELIYRRGDHDQVGALQCWLDGVLGEYENAILSVDADVAQVWGRLRAPHPEHALDKLIAATALIHDLTIVTRNERDFLGTGAAVLNPFAGRPDKG